MKIFFEAPQLTIISAPIFVEPEHLKIEWGGPWTSPGERLVEYAGRLCYMSQNNPAKKGTREYLDNIKKQGHGSVLEHANYSMLFEGVSRSFTHELVRHRAGWAYSQLSQRYVNENDCQFVIPPAMFDVPKHELEGWKEAMLSAREKYCGLANMLTEQYAHIEDKTARRKAAREAARSILPNATETKIVATANARAWRTMLHLRTSPAAEREIRRAMIAALKLLTIQAPGFFNDFEIYTADDGHEAARATYLKV